MLADQVERQQRVAQVVRRTPRNEHEVEALGERGDIVDRELRELDLGAHHLRDETGLAQIGVVGVDAEHPRRPPHCFISIRIEAAVAADIEHTAPAPAQIGRQGRR